MLSDLEERFLSEWERNRLKERKLMRQVIIGIPVGMLFAIPVLLLLFSGRFWYIRADAVAASKMSPAVLVIAILLIIVFVAIFYKRHQWDMKEQYYQELLAKKHDKKQPFDAAAPPQQQSY